MATIAVVDDDAAVRTVFKEVLETQGYEVLLFSDGAPFVATANFSKIDLAIIDLRMPTGGESVVRIMGRKGLTLPVVIIGGHITDDAACRLCTIGAHEVLEKPVSAIF